MSNPIIPLPHGYHLEEVDYKEWMPYALENMGIPFSATVSFDARSFNEGTNAFQKRLEWVTDPKAFLLFYLVKKDEEIVGWHSSRQNDWNQLYMELTGIYPEHQGKGLYKAILPIVMERATKEGFEVVTSKHHANNNAVLVPKMRAGFTIHSFEIHPLYGLMVHLRYYTQEKYRQLIAFRTGHARLPVDFRPLMALWEDDTPPKNA